MQVREDASEVESHRELQLPRCTGPNGAVQTAGDETKRSGRSERRARIPCLDAIEQIECFDAKHQRLALGDPRILLQGEIDLHQTGAGSDAAARISPRTARWNRKRRRV